MGEFNRLIAGADADLHDIDEALKEVKDNIDEDILMRDNDATHESDDNFN